MGVQCQSPFHIYMHNYTIATVLYESFAREEQRKNLREKDCRRGKERGKEGGRRTEWRDGKRRKRREEGWKSGGAWKR